MNKRIWTAATLTLALVGLFATPMQAQWLREHLAAGPDLKSEHGSIQSGGKKRTYRVYVPGTLHRGLLPVVFVFHGGGGTGMQCERTYDMNEMADKYDFAVVYPDGINKHWSDGRALANPDIDDIAFISSLIDKVVKEKGLDPNKVFACGISNGGFFSNYLALRLSSKVKGICSIAGDIPEDDAKLVTTHPVSVMLIHGTNDELVPFDGGEIENAKFRGIPGKVMSHDATLKKWLTLNGGATGSSTSYIPAKKNSVQGLRRSPVMTPVSITTYSTAKGATVTSVVIKNGGHTWPGHVARGLFGLDGVTPMNFDASKMLSDFFQQNGAKP